MKRSYTLLLVLAGLVQSAHVAQAQPKGPPGPAVADLAGEVKAVFRKHCFECHGGIRKSGGLTIFNYKALVENKLVVSKNVAESLLYQRMVVSDESQMPPPKRDRLSQEEVYLVRDWINAGAPDFPPDVERPAVKEREKGPALEKVLGVEYVLQNILADVRKTPILNRRYTRYISINHILSSPEGATRLELDKQYDAMAKALNHLTWKPQLVQPRPIDEARTVFAIDLRDFGWENQPYDYWSWDGKYSSGKRSKLDLFDLALLEYPYGIVYEGSPTFDYLLNEYIVPSGMVRPIAYVRADWFVSTMTLAPFYEDFLLLPHDVYTLEKKLGVNSYENIKNYVAKRGGMQFSGVSRNNRVVERHPSNYGGYWKSFDFQNNKGYENIFRNPIDFNFAGGEMVFTLPNGLNGYFVTDTVGRRIEEAPVTIVVDDRASDRTVRVGLSCMRCHVQGIVKVHDDVYGALKLLPPSYNYFDKEFALQLYPGQEVLQKLVYHDTARFVGAMTQLTGKPWEKQPSSPLTGVSLTYLDSSIGLQKAAGELGLLDPRDIESLVRLPVLGPLGLTPLILENDKKPVGIHRDTWEDYFDEVVKALGLGIPVVPLDGVLRREFPSVNEPFKMVLAATNAKTKRKTGFYQPGDELFITATNHSPRPVYVELIVTSTKGRKFLLTQKPVKVMPGDHYRYPPAGANYKVGGQTGKEQVTMYASYDYFEPGQLLRGREYYNPMELTGEYIKDYYGHAYKGEYYVKNQKPEYVRNAKGEYLQDYYISDRVVHPYYGYAKDASGRWQRTLDGSSMIRRTMDIETK